MMQKKYLRAWMRRSRSRRKNEFACGKAGSHPPRKRPPSAGNEPSVGRPLDPSNKRETRNERGKRGRCRETCLHRRRALSRPSRCRRCTAPCFQQTLARRRTLSPRGSHGGSFPPRGTRKAGRPKERFSRFRQLGCLRRPRRDRSGRTIFLQQPGRSLLRDTRAVIRTVISQRHCQPRRVCPPQAARFLHLSAITDTSPFGRTFTRYPIMPSTTHFGTNSVTLDTRGPSRRKGPTRWDSIGVIGTRIELTVAPQLEFNDQVARFIYLNRWLAEERKEVWGKLVIAWRNTQPRFRSRRYRSKLRRGEHPDSVRDARSPSVSSEGSLSSGTIPSPIMPCDAARDGIELLVQAAGL